MTLSSGPLWGGVAVVGVVAASIMTGAEEVLVAHLEDPWAVEALGRVDLVDQEDQEAWVDPGDLEDQVSIPFRDHTPFTMY